MKSPLTLLLIILPTIHSFSQDSEHGILVGPEWFDGSVMLVSGREIKGLIKYNDKTDIVSIENGYEAKSFTARHVKAFEFYDEIETKQRIYYSIEIEDRFYQLKRPVFFEVLMDLNQFAVISKLSPIHMEKKEYATPAIFNPVNGAFSSGRFYGYPSTISYTERIFLISREGELKPYLEITEKEIDGLFHDRTIIKNKILDDQLLKRFTGSKYKDLVEYAATNNHDLSQKKGLMATLQFYKTLSK
jgi:hypothetical protein